MRRRVLGKVNARKTLFSATRAISDFYANMGGDRCAANEQWRFQCDDGRRIAIKTALNRRKEDGRERPEDEDHEYYYLNEFEWLSAFERFHVPCLIELSLGFICGKSNG
ncbi:phosphatidylinositol 4,5-biphosphate-dependent ARF1 GTPase-activating protein [Trichinella spiralis]|uniref:phosphatidylinositol 4,5-biphosphate-dependent ARF1 GTPase-activating protein n=1 Tax=Trichinella spiralis TaxID=6334 RepID=UPI0001EFCFFC|nr:phosphatidylinositol 4,5-biphosphate-dependent ARF1 GTPase-activating protein [Trichinella spiralis]